ncbi:TPA: hypothetical protein ACPVGV_005062, partial [Escherichia coli]
DNRISDGYLRYGNPYGIFNAIFVLILMRRDFCVNMKIPSVLRRGSNGVALLLLTVFCKNGDITNPELSGGKMPDAGRNMTWDLRAPAPTPSHLRATVAIKGSFRGAEF